MKMNGFTLIELIATMALVAVLATVILINMTGIKNNEEENQTNRFQTDIEEAACAYIDMSKQINLRNVCKEDSSKPECDISLKLLISDAVALVEKDEYDPSTNKTAEELQDNIYVHIYWEGNCLAEICQKKCEMKRR